MRSGLAGGRGIDTDWDRAQQSRWPGLTPLAAHPSSTASPSPSHRPLPPPTPQRAHQEPAVGLRHVLPGDDLQHGGVARQELGVCHGGAVRVHQHRGALEDGDLVAQLGGGRHADRLEGQGRAEGAGGRPLPAQPVQGLRQVEQGPALGPGAVDEDDAQGGQGGRGGVEPGPGALPKQLAPLAVVEEGDGRGVRSAGGAPRMPAVDGSCALHATAVLHSHLPLPRIPSTQATVPPQHNILAWGITPGGGSLNPAKYSCRSYARM